MIRSVCGLVRQKWIASTPHRHCSAELNIESKADVSQQETKTKDTTEEVVISKPSERYLKFKEKLRSDAPLICMPKGVPHPAHEKEPLEPWPNNTNPFTGEIGGPRGPEPTRYGDWENKGRVTDF